MHALPLIRQFSETRIKPKLNEGKTLDIGLMYKKANNAAERGYYLHVRELIREGLFVRYILFKSPYLELQLNTVSRKSAKAEEQAFSILKSLVDSDRLKSALDNAGFTC